ncbi:hypothetical protein ACWOBJ_06190 [Hutsoniella sourekii]
MRARTLDGELVTIEMQIRIPSYFIERTEYYAFACYVSGYAVQDQVADAHHKYSSPGQYTGSISQLHRSMTILTERLELMRCATS